MNKSSENNKLEQTTDKKTLPEERTIKDTPAVTEEFSPLEKLLQKLSASNQNYLQEIQAEIDQLKKLIQEREEYLRLLQRVQADFINYQNRVKREKESWEKYQAAEIIRELLPAFDNLGRFLPIKCVTEEAEVLRQGVELSYREILRLLEKNSITLIKTVGQKFDPAFHEGVGTIETTDEIPGTVIKEVRAGFMIHDRVLRPAQVIITTLPPSSPNQTSQTSPDLSQKSEQSKSDQSNGSNDKL